MYFVIEDNDLLKKYNTIQDKISADIRKEFNSDPVYNKEYLKTKIKSHSDEVTFLRKKIPKMESSHTCLAVIGLGSALTTDENYHLKGFLTECKYIIDVLERSSDDSDDSNDSGEE